MRGSETCPRSHHEQHHCGTRSPGSPNLTQACFHYQVLLIHRYMHQNLLQNQLLHSDFPPFKDGCVHEHPPLTMISLCSSRFFKKLENSRKEASVRRKASLFCGQSKGKPTKTSSLRTYAAFIVSLCISNKLKFEVSEGVRKLPLGCRETWKDRWSDHGRPCFQSRFSMN